MLIHHKYVLCFYMTLTNLLYLKPQIGSLDNYALMRPSFCHVFVTSRLQWNLFVKPEEQGYVYIVIALARKGRMKFNHIAHSKQQNICARIRLLSS